MARTRSRLGAAGAAGSAEQRRAGRLPLRVRQRRGGPGDARERGGRHAHRTVPVCTQGEPDAGRRHAGAYLSRGHEQRRTRWRTERDAESLGRCRPQAAGAADRRDRRAGGRHPAVGAAATAYDQRPAAFPHTIVLCGVPDVRDYRIHSTAENRLVLGGSAFDIKSESLRLGDFSEQEIGALLGQHTAATGQAFTAEAVRLILTRTAGQPWLVNALCREACFEDEVGRDRARPVTAHAIPEAQERLILRRDTHVDDLAHKLREERVRRVVELVDRGRRLRLRPGAGGAGRRRHAAHRQPDLRRGGAAASELRGAGRAAAADGVVRGRGRRAGR